MLVLSRKSGEFICIGDTIKISVLEVRGNRVRLGITAPRGVAVHRPESQAGQLANEAVTVPGTTEMGEAK